MSRPMTLEELIEQLEDAPQGAASVVVHGHYEDDVGMVEFEVPIKVVRTALNKVVLEVGEL